MATRDIVVVGGNDGPLHFRCHTGHAFTANSLLAMMTNSIEETLWSTAREIQESVVLLRHMARHLAGRGEADTAARFLAKAGEVEARVQLIKQLAFQHEQISEDQLRHPSALSARVLGHG